MRERCSSLVAVQSFFVVNKNEFKPLLAACGLLMNLRPSNLVITLLIVVVNQLIYNSHTNNWRQRPCDYTVVRRKFETTEVRKISCFELPSPGVTGVRNDLIALISHHTFELLSKGKSLISTAHYRVIETEVRIARLIC